MNKFENIPIINFDKFDDCAIGLPVNYIPWAANNPDGTGECVGIYNNQNGLGDYGCKASVRFVCEISSE